MVPISRGRTLPTHHPYRVRTTRLEHGMTQKGNPWREAEKEVHDAENGTGEVETRRREVTGSPVPRREGVIVGGRPGRDPDPNDEKVQLWRRKDQGRAKDVKVEKG